MAVTSSVAVLVVDDSKSTISVIRRLFHQIGFRDVDDAGDGASAFAKMRAKHYGLVLSDWNMGSMTGHEFLCQLRADPLLKLTPFIMMTAETNTEKVIAARKAGVDNYIIKPFDAVTLKAKITSVLAARNAARDRVPE